MLVRILMAAIVLDDMRLVGIAAIVLGIGGLLVWWKKPQGYDEGLARHFKAVPLPLASGLLIALGVAVLLMG